MTRVSRLCWAAGRLLSALLLGLTAGCATTLHGAFDPALLKPPAVTAADRSPARVALAVRPNVQDFVQENVPGLPPKARLQLGRIVEESLAAAMATAVRGEVLRVGVTPPVGGGISATLMIEAVRVAHASKLLWLLPVPVFPFVVGDADHFSTLAFDLSLLDGQGRTVWTRTYDGGQETWKSKYSGGNIETVGQETWKNNYSAVNIETVGQGMVRMAHETAWRLSQQAVADLREWLVAERNKPRDL